MADFKMAAIIKLSQNEWVSFFVQSGTRSWQVLSLREKTKMVNPRWWNSSWQNSRWLLSSNWVRKSEWSFYVQGGWIHIWQNSRWLPSSSWVRMNEWRFFVQNGKSKLGTNLGQKCEWEFWESEKLRWHESKMVRILDGRIQDGCHHQVKWEWMTLSQIELVWVRVRMEWEVFWVNLREDNKVSAESIQHGRIQDGCHHQVESEWMSEVFLCKMSQFERTN